MASYNHITPNDRIMLSALNTKGFTQAEIARELGKNQSTISRELSRNKVKNIKYHAGYANRIYHERKRKVAQILKRIENDTWLQNYIEEKIKNIGYQNKLLVELKGNII